MYTLYLIKKLLINEYFSILFFTVVIHMQIYKITHFVKKKNIFLTSISDFV